MNTKAELAFAIVLSISVIVGVNFVGLTESNYKPYQYPTIIVFSPSEDQVYDSSNVLLNVSLNRYDTSPPFDVIKSLNYSLDGQQDKPLPYTISSGIYCHGKTTLYNLTDGPHVVFVHSEAKHGEEIIAFNATVSFVVETTIKPVVTQYPTLQVLSVSIGAVVIVSVSLIIYFKAHQKQSPKKN
ncbi:MAG: hypothetical protein ACFCUE_13100 [Candidatus Bathyarchaeia archaeon]|jgi:hypothetical protein